MAMFARQRDVSLIRHINRELMGNVITQQAAFYQFKLEECLEKKEKRFHNLEYHWNYPKKVDKDYVYLEKIHTKLVKSLSISLNQFHNVNFNERYWRILLDPFLFYYISTFFDRWEQIRSASRIKGKLYLGIPNFFSHFLKSGNIINDANVVAFSTLDANSLIRLN